MSDTFSETNFPEAGPPYWLIAGSSARYGTRELEIFTLDFGDEIVLPMFGDQSQAETFTWSTGLARSSGSLYRRVWEPRPCSGGALISLLSCTNSGMIPCAGVSRVAFDPPAETLDDASISLLSVSRESFIDHLLGRGRSWFENRQQRTTPATRTQDRPEPRPETL